MRGGIFYQNQKKNRYHATRVLIFDIFTILFLFFFFFSGNYKFINFSNSAKHRLIMRVFLSDFNVNVLLGIFLKGYYSQTKRTKTIEIPTNQPQTNNNNL